MIKHIVFFKVKEDNKVQRCEAIKNRLSNLPNLIDCIIDYEIGINEKDSERAFDMSLISTFHSYDALNKYAIHDKHVEVVEFIKENTIESKVVDYSF